MHYSDWHQLSVIVDNHEDRGKLAFYCSFVTAFAPQQEQQKYKKSLCLSLLSNVHVISETRIGFGGGCQWMTSVLGIVHDILHNFWRTKNFWGPSISQKCLGCSNLSWIVSKCISPRYVSLKQYSYVIHGQFPCGLRRILMRHKSFL